MNQLKALWVTTGLLVLTFILGFFSSKFIKPILANMGLHQNWAWPVICLLVALFVSNSSNTPLLITGGGFKAVISRIGLGLLAGVALQLLFIVLKARGSFHYQGLSLMPFLFQVAVSFCEELLFRGALQAYLAKHFGRALPSQMIAAILISVAFGIVHGLNPILFGSSAHFDSGWFWGTCSLSILAGFAYGITRKVDAAFGVHLGFNIIATFF